MNFLIEEFFELYKFKFRDVKIYFTVNTTEKLDIF
jgi:hypothetical protein